MWEKKVGLRKTAMSGAILTFIHVSQASKELKSSETLYEIAGFTVDGGALARASAQSSWTIGSTALIAGRGARSGCFHPARGDVHHWYAANLRPTS